MEITKGIFIVTTGEIASKFIITSEYKEYFERYCVNNHILLTIDIASVSVSKDENTLRAAVIIVEVSAHLYPLKQGAHIPHLCQYHYFGQYTYDIFEKTLKEI